jgi:ribonucleotide reductase alpha subunit
MNDHVNPRMAKLLDAHAGTSESKDAGETIKRIVRSDALQRRYWALVDAQHDLAAELRQDCRLLFDHLLAKQHASEDPELRFSDRINLSYGGLSDVWVSASNDLCCNVVDNDGNSMGWMVNQMAYADVQHLHYSLTDKVKQGDS